MTPTNRVHWLDNLRSITIFLVVLYHVGGVYEAAGLWGWFWIVDDPSTITWVGIIGIIFDIMVMPLMFFISGYLTPPGMCLKRAFPDNLTIAFKPTQTGPPREEAASLAPPATI